jgi:hypothetical protein
MPLTKSGNLYGMVMVEHLSKYLELVALPSKEATHTAWHFLDRVLCRYGAPAEVVTDRGTEYQGEFQALLTHCFIDHREASPNHPQSDGAAERCVQTVKRAVLKYSTEDTSMAERWDEQLPWIALGYNCSPQASTKFTPYSLIFGLDPLLPSGHHREFETPLFAEPFNPESQERFADMVRDRAHLLQERLLTAGCNLAAAQHKDTLRYAYTRSGAYRPNEHIFLPGDFVRVQTGDKIKRALVGFTHDRVLRVVEVRHNGTALLQGKCGGTVVVSVSDLTPCHLPDLDGTIDPTLWRPRAGEPCSICKRTCDASLMLLCDTCNTAWHTFCLGLRRCCVTRATRHGTLSAWD